MDVFSSFLLGCDVSEAGSSGPELLPGTNPRKVARTSNDVARSLNDAARSLNDAARSLNDAARSLNLNDAARSLNDAARSLNDAARSLNDAARSLNDAARSLNDAARSLHDGARDSPEAFPAKCTPDGPDGHFHTFQQILEAISMVSTKKALFSSCSRPKTLSEHG